MFGHRKHKPPMLMACVGGGIGNVEIPIGGNRPHELKNELTRRSADSEFDSAWIEVRQPGGQLTVRLSAVVAMWITPENAA